MLTRLTKAGVRRRADGLCLAVCFLTIAYSFAAAGEATLKEKSKSTNPFQTNNTDPIFITSDRMEMDRKKGTIIYSGRVVAKQGEATIKGDKLTASYSEDLKQITEIVAEGNVHITQADRVATGNKAVFDGKKQTITLSGNPVVRQGNSELSGSRILFLIEQDRFVAEGKVKATIFPGELKKGDQQESNSGIKK